MKTLLLILCGLLLSTVAQSQVSGTLTDTNGSPVPFATAVLLKSADSTLVRSAASDEKGVFRLSAAPSGTYTLKISCVGYMDYFSPLTIRDPAYDAGTIRLKAAGQQLSEVVIRSSKPLVQQEPGGLAVNVQNSIMTKGSSVLQVLSRSPGVIVDPQTSAISLNGKSGVMVMMDGKLLRLSADQVAALLNGMTADDIDKIELLATPPAKYDADGNAGLINIVTKKNKRHGTNGSVTASAGYGKADKASADINLNYNSGKFSLHASYDYARDHYYSLLLAEGTEDVPIIGGLTNFHYNGQGNTISAYQGFGGGFDYHGNAATTTGGSVYYSSSSDQNTRHNFGNYALPDSNLVFDSQLSGNSHTHYLHPSLYLEQTINKDQKFNVNLDYFGHHSNSPTQVQSNFSDSLFAPRQRNLANADINVFVAQLDYSNSFNKQVQLEAGLKGTYTRSQSVAGIENLVNGQWVPIGAGTSNDLATRELIGAGYAVLNWKPDSLTSLSGGARYEYSRNTTDHSLNAQYFVDRKLGRLFPDVFLSRKLNEKEQLQLSYTERISRPTFADLASYVAYNDPVSVFTGNPALKPTITHNLKLAYNWQDYLFSILYSRDADPIEGVQGVPGPTRGLVYLMPENADWQNNLTAQATIPVKIADWWEMNYNFIGGWHKYKISYFPELLVKSYFSYSLNFSESFKLPGNYAIELSGYYNSVSYGGNNRSNGNAIFNLGFKKELENNNGSFQLSISDIFRANVYRGHLGPLITDAFNSDVYVNYQPESHFCPIIKLSYSRSFGTASKSQKSRDNAAKDEKERI
ncbi:TonB-dependent receptor [Mucilaginibacter sp. BJC16-A38]|uniref:TonB-dependent receptor domain-containing protein n=1 Tax=Mucilaginibacter phenanthrenivorans TaxID=1234842 RepID=UPI0021583D14|nr:TonB-dependent receptor [Mucilaginibacter phenanthrenivorans]MCR8560536.1 TonB-dependent receptor [Mucilaginibacter phenanthrenivorans]